MRNVPLELTEGLCGGGHKGRRPFFEVAMNRPHALETNPPDQDATLEREILVGAGTVRGGGSRGKAVESGGAVPSIASVG